MAREFVQHEIADGVAVVTLNRPPANALNSQLMGELGELFDELAANPEIKSVVVTAAGTRFFVGGADVTELLEQNTVEQGEHFSLLGQVLMDKVERFPRPVIAAVNGYALGGGCELAMACDIRLAAASARFGQPEVNLGILPGAGGSQRLPRLVGKGKAKELLMTGDMIDAAEALRIGLVDRVVPAEELLNEAVALAKKIAAKAPKGVELIKRAVNEGTQMTLEEGIKLENHLFGLACATEDKNEGIKAFLEKRPAQFRGR